MCNILNCKNISIRNAKIGHFNLVNCVSFVMKEGSWLRSMNRISLVNNVEMGAECEISKRNVIMGLNIEDFKHKNDCNFYFGEKSLLTNHHRIDCTASVRIGSNVVIAGSDTQVWTHGFDFDRKMIIKPIVIDNDIYIGSRCTIVGGVHICSNVIIGASTTVSSSIKEPGFYVSSTLIKKVTC